MTEKELNQALLDLSFEYFRHTPKERELLEPEYKANRERLRKALIHLVMERKEKEVGMRNNPSDYFLFSWYNRCVWR